MLKVADLDRNRPPNDTGCGWCPLATGVTPALACSLCRAGTKTNLLQRTQNEVVATQAGNVKLANGHLTDTSTRPLQDQTVVLLL